MKKKLLFGASAAALAAVMCVGFAACGESGGAEGVKGEEFSEETFTTNWAAAFKEENFTNFKVVAKQAREYSKEGKTSKSSATLTGVRAEGLERIEVSEKYDGKSSSAEYYNDLVNSVFSKKDKETNNKWAETSYCECELDDVLGMVFGFEDMGEDFTYSASDNGYVYEERGNKVVLKFKDGKVAALYGAGNIYSFSTDEGSEPEIVGTQSYDYVFTYGGQKVTPPKLSSGEGSESNTSVNFVGTWKLESLTMNGHTYRVGDTIEVGEGDTETLTEDYYMLKIYDGGTVDFMAEGVTTGNGTWEKLGADSIRLIQHYEGEDGNILFMGSMKEGKLVISFSPSDSMVLVRA